MMINDVRVGSIAISHAFFDRYLPAASGEYVKVYLMLLRLLEKRDEELTLSLLADKLDHTEKDVLRALTYWEIEGLLTLEFSGEELISLSVQEILPLPQEKTLPVASSPQETPPKSFDLALLQGDEDFRQLLFVAETYLGRTLNQRDVEFFAYLYENLHFRQDLIEYLIEYCVEGGHKSTKYMEAVALAWHAEGKTSVEQVKEASRAYTRENRLVMKAFGIRDRVLGTQEQRLVNQWLREEGMSLELVLEACNQTLASIHRPSFEYADKILKRWKSGGISTAEEAKKDNENRRREKGVVPKSATRTNSSTNRFHHLDQRTTDYDALFKQEERR